MLFYALSTENQWIMRYSSMVRSLAALAAVLTTVACFAADPAIAIQIRMIAGDDASYPSGSQAATGLTVEITDDQGRLCVLTRMTVAVR